MYSFEQVYPQNYPEQFAPLDKIPSSAGLDDNSSVNHSEAPNRFPRRRPRRSASVDQKRTRSWGVRSMDSDDDEEDLSSTPTHDSEENQNKTQEKRRLLPSRDVEASTSTSQSFNTNDHMLSTKSSTDTHPDHKYVSKIIHVKTYVQLLEKMNLMQEFSLVHVKNCWNDQTSFRFFFFNFSCLSSNDCFVSVCTCSLFLCITLLNQYV